MIAIRFSPIYEDRVSVYLKHIKLRELGVEYNFEDIPSVQCNEDKLCYWILKPLRNEQINLVFSILDEMKSIMGIEKLEFQYCCSMREYFLQYNNKYGSLRWFKV